MTTFVDAVKNQSARTENNMKARQSTASACVDLFSKIGASRGKNIIPEFVAALVENEDIALRIALWARDIRSGAGERQIFRDILQYLEQNNPEIALKLIPKVPELGRWDDLLCFKTESMRFNVFEMISKALNKGDSLCAKWMPRKGQDAIDLRTHMKLSPKQYRKTLVNLTKVVETQMCAKDWDNINFSQVPSVAASRYRKAFYRNTPKYTEYVEALVEGKDPTVKVNAGAIFPYDVIKDINVYRKNHSKTEIDFIVKQWEALPNFVGDAKILPLVDVSSSMSDKAGKSNLTCLNIAVGLGLYLAEKNEGKFKDTFLTFSGKPKLLHLSGNIVQKTQQMVSSEWGMNTNLHAALDKILNVAIKYNVSQEEMPDYLVILSDMQFDACVKFDDSAIEMINRKYKESGYNTPTVIFWNLNSYNNVPVKFDEKGVALVSGFSPSIVKSILSVNNNDFTPETIMLETVMRDRYDYL